MRIPPSFDGYELRGLLGRGAMGEVHLAHDTLLDRPVAIKLIDAATASEAHARERFFVEARAVARLSHPNVVAVYRVGLIEGTPYLVSELVRGTPLDRVTTPVSASMALGIAHDLASGLAAAHRRGVLHRDIKPGNAILSEDGRVKLLDFGIAKLLESSEGGRTAIAPAEDRDALDATRTEPAAARAEPIEETTCATRIEPPATQGSVEDALAELTLPGTALGTPRYMAPEIWRGEPATFASDVYSFGALLFALCAGKPPHGGRSLDELRESVLEGRAPPLAELAPHVDSRLAAIVDSCLAREAEARFASGGELRAAVARLLPGARAEVLPEGNPYRGLASFEVEHRDLFFGRDSETRMIVERLATESFVLVAGDSGTGKSSLCRAAVLPRLAPSDGEGPRVVTLVPGKRPARAAADLLAPLLDCPPAALLAQLLDDPAGLARRIRGAGPVVLFVDPMEELVTVSERHEALAVAELFGWLASPGPGARLLGTVRSDFLARLALLPRIGDAVAAALFFLRPLSAERIREVIVAPAEAKGVRFETEALVDELVASAERAGSGGLPLLQFALAELWEARGERAIVTEATLEAIGGVAGALARHADDVLRAMRPAERLAARKLLLRLVTSERTRVSAEERELATLDEHAPGALARLVRGRLLVARETANGTLIEIAHEALVAGWPTLSGWLTAEAGAQRARERLRHAVDDWQRLGEAREALWGKRQLAELGAVDALDAVQQRFVRSSRALLRRRLTARVAAAAALPLVAALAFGAVSQRERARRDAQADAELAAADHALAEARSLGREAAATRHEALRLFEGPEREAAEEAWARHLALLESLAPAQARAGRHLEKALLVDPERIEARERLADALFEQALAAEQRHDEARRDELLGRLAVYDDGRRRAQWNAPARVSFTFDPPDAELRLARYRTGETGRLVPEPIDDAAELPPGSYLARVTAPGHATVHLPFVTRRDETLELTVVLPRASEVPPGYAYVPPGEFLSGTAADEQQRRDFFHAVPLHRRAIHGFFIAEHETTFGEWLAFLEALPPTERAAHRPRAGDGGFKGGLSLERLEEGGWRLLYRPAGSPLEASTGQPLRYPGRAGGIDWRELPVVGIAVDDAEAYVRWLDRSGKLEGARLCSELEWERGARGADARVFPHGMRLHPADANHDATYGKRPDAMGPDPVGSHPASTSPFGLFDMAGNVWEWTRSSQGGYAARGGSFYFGPSSSRIEDREETEPSFRDVSVGLRVCADPPRRIRTG